jgi:GPH family glycoside/pentoside/hexuronide:cation symporter
LVVAARAVTVGASAIPLRTKLLYGTSRVGAEALGKSSGLWLLYYYAPPSDAHLPTLLPSLAVGVLLTVAGIVAALDDAIVGYFSDRTRTRFGRRIPYIVLGAPLWSIFFVLLFTPPPDAGNAATAVYLLFVFEAVSLFRSVVVSPYEALLPEMAATSDERVSLEAIKVYLGVAGTAIGLVVSTVLVHEVGFRAMAVTIGALALICQYVAIAGVWDRAKLSRIPARIGFRDALRATFRNRSFQVLLPTIVLFALAFQLLQTDIPFYVHAIVGKHSWLSATLLFAVAIGAALISLPLFARLAQRTSKRHAYSLSMLAAAATFPLLGIAGLLPGIPATVQLLVVAALVGAPIGAHFLFPVPLTADVIDDDSAKTELRREATYLGSSSFVERTANSVAPLLIVLVRLLGDTRGHSVGVRLVGPLAGLILLAAYLIFQAYDLPDEVHERIQPEAVAPGPRRPAIGPP